jgi:hypothetical protein
MFLVDSGSPPELSGFSRKVLLNISLTASTMPWIILLYLSRFKIKSFYFVELLGKGNKGLLH